MALISKKDQLTKKLEEENKDKRACVTCDHYEKPFETGSRFERKYHQGCTKHFSKIFDGITGASTIVLGNCFTLNKSGKCVDHSDLDDNG